MLCFQVHVQVGTHDRTNPEQQIRVKSIALHPDWDGTGRIWKDLAILTLDHPVTFTDKIRPLCLPSDASLSYAGETATAAGWGVADDGYLPAKLRKVQMKVISNEQCRWINTSYDLCAFGEEDDFFGIRPGDSGTLLFLMENERSSGDIHKLLMKPFLFRYTGISVTSRTYDKYDIFTRITPNIKTWIQSVASGTQDSDVTCSSA